MAIVEAPGFVAGFDNDMTLVNTEPSIRGGLVRVSRETGVAMDIDEICSRLGPPITDELAVYFEDPDINEALAIYRGYVGGEGLNENILLPGAMQAIAAVRERGGRSAVLTAKHQPIAEATLNAAGIHVDVVFGDLWAEQKAVKLTELGASCYTGDHVQDMMAARSAGAFAVGVTTGRCTEAELYAAGANIVIPSLEFFPNLL